MRYQYNQTKPDTAYKIKVSTIRSGRVSGSSSTTVTTDAAKYSNKGTNVRLYLPKPPDNAFSAAIMFNDKTLFQVLNGDIDGSPVTEDGVTVDLTGTDTQLTINSLTTTHAGYYFTKVVSGNTILGGKLLVVTDSPTKPTITASQPSPVVGTSVTLGCSSTSRTKPDNHGLVFTSSWKLNGSLFTNDRFDVSGTSLIIDPVRLRDRYNAYTCTTMENRPGYSGSPSEDSEEYLLTPLYGPQFVDIEGADGRSPLIIGDVFGPVVCNTDCNPACLMEWRRGGVLLQLPQTSDNQLVLRDSQLPRTREVTYTCNARVPTNAGFIAPAIERNVSVQVYFAPRITNMTYLDEKDFVHPITTGDDIRIPETFSLALDVAVDSNPDPDVTLFHGQQRIVNGGRTLGKYEVVVENLQCNHTGMYRVSASNIVTRDRSDKDPDEKQFELHVSCSPRRLGFVSGIIGLAGKKGQTIPVNVTVIANPKPTAQWSDGVRVIPNIANNEYTHIVRGTVQINSVPEDYRQYHVNITNGVGDALTVTFQIRPEDVPDSPVDFKASVIGSNTVTVTWTSGFDGGNPQLFHVDVMSEGQEWMINRVNITDIGTGAMMVHTLDGLNPSTEYFIRLNVSNRIGRGNSSVISVQTIALPPPPSSQSTVVVTIVVIVIVILVGVVAIIGFLIVKQRRIKQGRAVNHNVITDKGTDNSVYAVVTKAPKGGSAARNQVEIAGPSEEYAVVSKPKKGGAAKVINSTTSPTDEYAVVSKPPKGHEEMIYENSELSNSRQPASNAGPSRTVNQDGLIYIDVEIKQQPGQNRGVIHGAEDRTQYALVDFSKSGPVITE
ncbi:protein sidekick-1-like isoform X2 [Argopecten irradians]|uniref:protein sidekick-1-like isoform X2 n=1 Tax=Argopecten irradians TaxID=31199 RepID=UPI0037116F34